MLEIMSQINILKQYLQNKGKNVRSLEEMVESGINYHES